MRLPEHLSRRVRLSRNFAHESRNALGVCLSSARDGFSIKGQAVSIPERIEIRGGRKQSCHYSGERGDFGLQFGGIGVRNGRVGLSFSYRPLFRQETESQNSTGSLKQIRTSFSNFASVGRGIADLAYQAAALALECIGLSRAH